MTQAMRNTAVLWFAAVVLGGVAARAQITSDGTLGTVVSEDAARGVTITGGTSAGTNLFHSFGEFNGGGLFEVDGAIGNVISRVTGDKPSLISGIRAQIAGTSDRSQANFLFLNPHGVLFDSSVGGGPSLDIDGAFYAVSASEVRFSNGASFSATTPATALTTAAPASFGFLDPRLSARISADSLDFAGKRISLVDAGVISNRSIRFEGGAVSLQGTNLISNRDIGFHVRSLDLDGSSLQVTIRPHRPEAGIDIVADRWVRLVDSTILSPDYRRAIPIEIRAAELSLTRSQIEDRLRPFDPRDRMYRSRSGRARFGSATDPSSIGLAGMAGIRIRISASERSCSKGGRRSAWAGMKLRPIS